MKNLLIALTLIIIFASCEEQKVEETKQIVVITNQLQDTVFIEHKIDKPIIVLTASKKKLINSFRPPIRDVAYFMLLHKEDYRVDRHHFICGKYKFWIANDNWAFRLDHPVEISLTTREKSYFWSLYTNYRNKELRLFEWESEIEIVLQKQ